MIQIDMPMPENCFDCPVCNEYLICGIPRNGSGFSGNDVSEFRQGKPKWCPLKEQEPVAPVLVGRMWECGKCYAPVGIFMDDRRDQFCRTCGTKVKWDD